MKLETLGERLSWARKHHARITQIDLREKVWEKCEVKISPNYISELELGKDKRPSFELMSAIASTLNVSLDWLAGFTEDITPASPKEAEITYFSEEADEISRIVDALHPEQRRVVLNVAQSMVTAPTARQMERREARDILESIERQLGRHVRLEVEKIMRNKGLPVNPAS